eukprot:11150554-Ditylum_brightwellii.AAC.1
MSVAITFCRLGKSEGRGEKDGARLVTKCFLTATVEISTDAMNDEAAALLIIDDVLFFQLCIGGLMT